MHFQHNSASRLFLLHMVIVTCFWTSFWRCSILWLDRNSANQSSSWVIVFMYVKSAPSVLRNSRYMELMRHPFVREWNIFSKFYHLVFRSCHYLTSQPPLVFKLQGKTLNSSLIGTHPSRTQVFDLFWLPLTTFDSRTLCLSLLIIQTYYMSDLLAKEIRCLSIKITKLERLQANEQVF